MKIFLKIGNFILCEGIKKILYDNMSDVIIEDCFTKTKCIEPDIVIFDSRFDIDGLKNMYPQANFLFLDRGLIDSEIACLIFCKGVNGIISPSLETPLFCKALRVISAGESWIEQNHLQILRNHGPKICKGLKSLMFSDNDRKIIGLLAKGLKNQEIANELCLSEATIKAHISRIYRSLNVKNRSQLTSLTLGNDELTH